jgi:peptidoglycan hydrolase CwlO-like protein
MVLLAILVASSSYSQYPIIKKIGKDSLILMTLKQGDDINKSFTQYQKKLDSLKDSVNYKRFTIDSLNTEFDKLDKKREEYKLRYEERLNMPVNTKYQYHDDGWDFAQKMVLIAVIVLQFFTIK